MTEYTDTMTTAFEPTSAVESSFAPSTSDWEPKATKRSFRMPKILPSFSFGNGKLVRRGAIVVGLILLVGTVMWITNIRVPVKSNIAGVNTNTSNATNVAKINQSYTFNARNDQGRPIDKKPLKMTISSVELTKRILIKGTPATARDQKQFLLLNIELDNTSTDRLFLPVNDLIRWQEGDKLRAPDVHNNLVLVDPISTKGTRVGFLVDESTKNFSIQVGEVNGPKQTIDLKL